jgi:predicted ATPase
LVSQVIRVASVELEDRAVDDSRQHDFVTAELDPHLLSTPFGAETKWHVITGAPCSGKTTLLNLLAEKGFRTVPETARLYYERELAKGRTLDEINADKLVIETGIEELQRSLESGLQTSEIAFLDRALPDSLTFRRLGRLNSNEILADCFQFRYASVFMLNRLPFLRNEKLGPEDEVSAAFVDEWLPRDYGALGYPVVRVPAIPPQERLAFVLENLTRRGLI